MRDPGVGRSGGLTDWYLMNVADMWACLQDHDPDNHWRHVAGWRKISELADQHLNRLRTYRRRLAQAWPPDTNEAARAYLAELDDLIAQVQRTHDAASANQSALAAATQALSSTRTELKKIHDEYADKLRQKRGWEQTAADPKAVAGSRNSQPPVTDADLEQLNVKARGIMYGLSSDLQQAQVTLRQPPAPKPNVRDGAPMDVYADNLTPVIPPIAPVSLPGMTIKRSTASHKPLSRPTKSTIGPVLSGLGQQVPPNPTPSAHPNVPAAPTVSPTVTGIPHPTRPSTEPKNPQPGNAPPRPDGRPGNRGSTTSDNPPGPPRAVTPGGIIGGPTSVGLNQPGSNGSPVRRVNPVGGVIGGGAAGTSPTGGAGSRPGRGKGISASQPPNGGFSSFGFSNPVGSARPRSYQPEDPQRWERDNPWQVEQGIDPVVRPPDEDGPIDPGPAIGLPK